jgi:hypothetical protein
MRDWRTSLTGGLAIGLAVAWMTPAPIVGQSNPATVKGTVTGKTPAGKPWSPRRTADGQPDLQGVWDFSSTTPMERPPHLGSKAFYTAEEIAALDKAAPAPDRPCFGNQQCFDKSFFDAAKEQVATGRTSLIIDPPDGRLPAYTPEGVLRTQERTKHNSFGSIGDHSFIPASASDFSAMDQCFIGINVGPPMHVHAYGNIVQLIQSRDYVVIHTEMSNHVRIVPLDGRPHLPQFHRLDECLARHGQGARRQHPIARDRTL